MTDISSIDGKTEDHETECAGCRRSANIRVLDGEMEQFAFGSMHTVAVKIDWRTNILVWDCVSCENENEEWL